MAGKTTRDPDSLEPILDWMRDIDRQIRTLQQPSGTQTAGLLNQVQAAIANIGAAVTAYLSSGFTTGSMTATGNVTVGGTIGVGGRLTANAGVTSTDVYNRSLTYGGLYKVQYVHQDGTMGYVSSSRRYKQDERPAVIPNIREVMRAFQIFNFRYIEAVENIGDDAAVEWGPMAEDVHEAGLYWLVEYDETGRPEGVRHERFAYLAILDAQDKQMQIDELASTVDALSARLDVAGL